MPAAAYFQSIGGASGDMLLAACLDAGTPLDVVVRELDKMGFSGYSLQSAPAIRREVRGAHLSVSLDQVPEKFRYLSPQAQLDAVAASTLSETVKARASRVLSALWKAEARVHGEPGQALELEELGTLDTLIDVVGVAVCLENLGVEQVFAAPLVLGEAQPPRWPNGYSNPAPATLELVAAANAPTVADRPIHHGAGELTTPTGAAILTTLAEFQRPAMSINRIGVGLGTKDPENFPNAVRLWLGQVAGNPSGNPAGPALSQVVLLETNLDDATGEMLGYVHERLFAIGALDVWQTPIQMKKNRPGVLLSALVPQDLEPAAADLILAETPTLGVRTRLVDRYVAARESRSMSTELGTVSVKIKSLRGRPVSVSPEFDDCRRIALESGLPLPGVLQRVTEQARRQFLEP